MNLLLDTHTFLWFANDDPQLSPAARQLIEDPLNQRWLSIASPWEVAIKIRTGKMTLPEPIEAFFTIHLPINFTQLLPITIKHLAAVASLPLHHRDPFDRLIISQAMVEDFILVSADSEFDPYPITRRW